VTLASVATRAGVSIGTVSKALSGTGRMRPETRERVVEAAAELGFTPSPGAPGRDAGRTWTVGLITTDGIGRFSSPVLLGAEDALGAGQISVLLCDTRGDAIREQHHLRTLTERRVDGIIVTGRRTDPRPPLAGVGSIPTVYALSPSTDPGDVSVVSDDAGGAALAVEHLLSLGRSRIAHVTGPAHHAAAQHRAARTLELLAAAGLAPATGRVHFGDWSEVWGRRAAEAVLHAAPDTDAVFCGNDQIARGFADALRERSIRVPEDIAIVGYDNWDTMTLASRPPLTTVDMNLGEVGRVAALRLIDAIEANAGPAADRAAPPAGTITIPCRLIVRESA
jgi:LacI family transcriptional regulator